MGRSSRQNGDAAAAAAGVVGKVWGWRGCGACAGLVGWRRGGGCVAGKAAAGGENGRPGRGDRLPPRGDVRRRSPRPARGAPPAGVWGEEGGGGGSAAGRRAAWRAARWAWWRGKKGGGAGGGAVGCQGALRGEGTKGGGGVGGGAAKMAARNKNKKTAPDKGAVPETATYAVHSVVGGGGLPAIAWGGPQKGREGESAAGATAGQVAPPPPHQQGRAWWAFKNTRCQAHKSYRSPLRVACT